MKKITLIFICTILLITLIGCKNNKSSEKVNDNGGYSKVNKDSKSLVLYFSATGTTSLVAHKLSEATDSDIIEIIPEIEYTSEDLNYNNDNSRANKEQNDATSRPRIKNDINIDQYDTIYLGYPIWWGTYPKIILTLLDNYNLDNKNIILFCTSGSTGIEESIKDIKQYNSNINIIDGKRFNSSVTIDELKNWINSLNISNTNIDKIYIKVNNHTLKVNLEDNSSSKALVEKLNKNDITIDMEDYANFEKVGDLGFSLPTNDKQITTTYGDVILYQGNKLTIYYDTNSWNFTKLGHIDDISQKKLKEILGSKDVKITLSLNN